MKVERRRSQGRPRGRWMDCIKKELAEKGLEALDTAERLHWKSMTSNGDPT